MRPPDLFTHYTHTHSTASPRPSVARRRRRHRLITQQDRGLDLSRNTHETRMSTSSRLPIVDLQSSAAQAQPPLDAVAGSLSLRASDLFSSPLLFTFPLSSLVGSGEHQKGQWEIWPWEIWPCRLSQSPRGCHTISNRVAPWV